MIKGEKKVFRNTKYLIYYPKDFDKNKKYPLFFHLHGAGSRGTDFAEFKGSTILNLLDEGNSPLSNAICVFPQCHNDTWFVEFDELLGLVKEMVNLPFVDKNSRPAAPWCCGFFVQDRRVAGERGRITDRFPF